jgi:hypothetical protein
LQAALAIAENLLLQNQHNEYLVEIISNIHGETRQYEKAINIITPFLATVSGYLKDFFSYRLAKLYSYSRDWDNTRHYALQVGSPSKFSAGDAFDLAGLLVNSAEPDKALATAFETLNRFYDDSAAHLKYVQLCMSVHKKDAELFPAVVREDCAVMLLTESGEEKIFVITDKNVHYENIVRPSDPFAQQLTGKSKGDQVIVDKGFGFTGTLTIISIIEIYTHAFRESLKLFETRFAGQQNIGVLKIDPGQPGDQFEQFVKESGIERNGIDLELFQLYKQRKATIGVLAGLFKRNVVLQWFNMLSSQEVFIYSFSQNEFPAASNAIEKQTPMLLDITSLLTMFFISKGENYFSYFTNKFFVSQSAIDELQECYEELERGAKEDIFTVRYEAGGIVGHTTPKEFIQQHREILQQIMSWCREYTSIVVPSKLVDIKREERKKMSDILGNCFYDCILLAEEYNAAVVSDDDNFKNMLRSGKSPAPFSTYHLVQYLAGYNKITHAAFDLFRLHLIESNYIFVPVSTEDLWQCFDKSGFKLIKPFTVALKGLLVMKPEFASLKLAQFLKKIYLESGLAISRDQIILFMLNDVSLRHDFESFKKFLLHQVENEFRLLQKNKEDFFQLLKAF